MTVSLKIKTINNIIEQTKTQYNLDRQTAKSSALSSGNISKYKFSGKRTARKAGTTKRFEYSPLGSDFKKQTDIGKKYQGLDRVHGFNKADDFKKSETKNKKIVDLNYDRPQV